MIDTDLRHKRQSIHGTVHAYIGEKNTDFGVP